MKRVFVVLVGLCLIAITTTFAQSVEVKRVETQKVDNGSEKGFEFNNLNNHEVTIEAELRIPCWETKLGYIVKDTKTFVIEAKSKYIWKVPLKVSAYGYLGTEETYVVFKAFKCL